MGNPNSDEGTRTVARVYMYFMKNTVTSQHSAAFHCFKVLYTGVHTTQLHIQTLPEIKIMIEERRSSISACVSYEVVCGARV